MKIARASQQTENWGRKTWGNGEWLTGCFERWKNTEVKDAPNELPKDTPADVACAVLGLLNKESCKDLEDYFETQGGMRQNELRGPFPTQNVQAQASKPVEHEVLIRSILRAICCLIFFRIWIFSGIAERSLETSSAFSLDSIPKPGPAEAATACGGLWDDSYVLYCKALP